MNELHLSNDNGTKALGNALATLFAAPAQMATALAVALTERGARGCEIPPPCWEPKPAGTCNLTLTPGGSATVRVHVTNCGWSRQVVAITATGMLAGWLKFEPTTLIVEPQSHATFLVQVHVPDKIPPGRSVSGPLLIRGCVDHFARMHVRVAECAGVTCCDLHVKDCADQIHHWYDHFYCPRPCRNPGSTRVVTHG